MAQLVFYFAVVGLCVVVFSALAVCELFSKYMQAMNTFSLFHTSHLI